MTIEIINQDCIKGLSTIAAGTASAIVTSVPYNSGIQYNSYKDNLPEDQYLLFLENVFKECKRCLIDQGSFFLNIGSKPSNQSLQFKVINLFSTYFHIQNSIIWVKSVYTKNSTAGHIKPINSKKYFNSCYEFIIHGVCDKPVDLHKLAIGVPYTDKSNIKRWSGKEDLKDRGNTWFIPYDNVRNKKEHPAAFPKELPLKCLKILNLDPEALVIDPFAGVGTTALACKDLGLNFIGFEIDPYYIEIAKEKLGQI